MRTVSKDKLLQKEPRQEWHSIVIGFVVSLHRSIDCLAGFLLVDNTGFRCRQGPARRGGSPGLVCLQTLQRERVEC